MGQAVETLIGLMPEGRGFALPHGAVRDLQLAALDERLREQAPRIRLVALRAEDAGIDRIRALADVVPLLLPHTAYKSYPETVLTGGKWAVLTRWLATVSAQPVDGIDLAGVDSLDAWIAACEQAGLPVSCSSGTTGKAAMLVASQADLDFVTRAQVAAVEWGSAIRRDDGRTPAGPAGVVARTPRNSASGMGLAAAFMDPAARRFDPGLPPATIGTLTAMVMMRRRMAEGTALPSEVAAFERESTARAEALAAAQAGAVEDIIAKRRERLFITGMWGALYPFAEAVRARGFSGADFHPENAVYLGGGLKRARLPASYREFVFETFNLAPRFVCQMYSMQELNSAMPRCPAGRYHVPPWVICLPLDTSGETLLEPGRAEIECRAAFFDLSLEGRWGGVISGDRIHLTMEPCACGNGSPSIRDDVERYADLEGDDKIACAGTVDAYVRGLS
ncbi:hypothetical protein [Novosphingobium sp.]|uniref:hypothetical protein n=1 Tax=Novosphingobium sp. TaxID=1874826 RepID=UPI0026045E80|nr:hypothetical protein [Novosphingobium sp.]